MILTLLAAAHAAPGNVITTELRTAEGLIHPSVFVAVEPPQPDADPPEPDADPPSESFRVADDVASTVLRSSDGVHVTLGLSERDVRAVYYRPDLDTKPVVVWGDNTTDRILPPGPCRAEGELPPGPCTPVDLDLPPGPCFELIALLGDGTTLGIEVSVQMVGGELDPGSLVGFNPQPEPPGDFPMELAFDLRAEGRRDAAITVNVALVADGRVLPIE